MKINLRADAPSLKFYIFCPTLLIFSWVSSAQLWSYGFTASPNAISFWKITFWQTKSTTTLPPSWRCRMIELIKDIQAELAELKEQEDEPSLLDLCKELKEMAQ